MSSSALDPDYFDTRSWARRLQVKLSRYRSRGPSVSFLDGHVGVVRRLLSGANGGPRMVVNIGADALLNFLETGVYKNLYDHPVVGGEARAPSTARLEVDKLLAFPNAADVYFGAVALGGAGVRFYGEYCMVIRPSRVHGNTSIFDRDSYDLLEPPLAGFSAARTRRIVASLRGEWDRDLGDLLLMKMLPRIPATQHLITSGHVSGLVMSDQEFVEIHLAGRIALADIEEVRQQPEEAAIEASIVNRRRARSAAGLHEILWVARRRQTLRRLEQAALPCRVAGLHGKGYQWT